MKSSLFLYPYSNLSRFLSSLTVLVEEHTTKNQRGRERDLEREREKAFAIEGKRDTKNPAKSERTARFSKP
jgi:hypothetical protein